MTEAEFGAIVHAALEMAAATDLTDVVSTLEGRRGRPLYESTWRRLAGRVPSYADEQRVVLHLVRIVYYGHQYA